MGVTVSIIIPCYNYARFLGQAIESALAQTIPSEVIVVDDGSTDNSAEVARRYPVYLIDQKNQGPGKTFNHGVAASHGKYFLLLSADDLVHPRFIESTLPTLMENRVAFVFTHAVTFGTEHAILLNQEYDVARLGLGGYMGGGVLMRRDAYDAVGGYDPAMRHGEDWDLWLRLAERGLCGKLVPRILFAYRKHGTGLAEKNSLPVRWKHLWQLYRKHPRTLRWQSMVRLGAYDILFFLASNARRISPRGYARLRDYLKFARPKLGGVQHTRHLAMIDGDDLGYAEMLAYLATMGWKLETP